MNASGQMAVGLVVTGFKMGGLERVVTYLVPLLRSCGCCPVLLTVGDSKQDFYAVSPDVQRIVVGGWKTPAEARRRNVLLERAITSRGMRMVFIHSYYSPSLSEDIEAIHRAGAKAVVHCHSSGTNFFARRKASIDIAAQLGAFRRADALIAISRVDRLFFRDLGIRAHYIPNPVADVPAGFVRKPTSGPALVWVGRFDADVKRPFDAVRIFERIHDRMPTASLTMVGDSEGPVGDTIRRYLSARSTLSAAVRLWGKTQDVWSRLAEADLMLVTSMMEGFSCALAEAYAAGVPAVGYALDSVELCRDAVAYRAVPQEDVAAAAERALDLLGDAAALRSASQAARQCFERFRNFDQVSAYRHLMDVVLSGDGETALESSDDDVRALIRAWFDHACQCRKYYLQAREKARERPKNIRECLKFIVRRLCCRILRESMGRSHA